MKNEIKTFINDLGHIVGTIAEFDELETEIAKLTDNELATLKAYMSDEFKWQYNIRVEEVMYAVSQLSTARFYPNIKTAADFGRYMAHTLGRVNLDAELQEFFDYEKYAKSLPEWHVGRLTSDGFIWHDLIRLPF